MKKPDDETPYETSGANRGAAVNEADKVAKTRHGTAAYIADLTKELSGLARGAGLETLAYLLDIAELEALAQTRRKT